MRTPIPSPHNAPADGDGKVLKVDYSVIRDLGRIDPFLVNVVSVSDVWIFLGSHGGITAGRRNAEHALFPYCTEDKLADTAAVTGAVTIVRTHDGRCWEPLVGAGEEQSRSRWLAKTILGDEVIWGDRYEDLGLEFKVSWRSSPRFGVVRECHLTNTSDNPVGYEILDGFQNLLPAGVTQRTQNELSVLLDAYKRSEIDLPTGLGLFSLSSLLTDLAEPSEALSTSVAWRLGEEPSTRLASSRQIRSFRRGDPLTEELDARGVRSAHLSAWSSSLEPGESASWIVVADIGLDAAQAHDLRNLLMDPASLGHALKEDLYDARRSLELLLASADGNQTTGDESASAHHLASVLYNAMRGGVPLNGQLLDREGFRLHLHRHNEAVARQVDSQIDSLPTTLTIAELAEWAQETGLTDVQRLSMTFLPITFSRRHGDPSRPWNRFDIVLTDNRGNAVSGFEGNWRDIFQNWEALTWSYPELTEQMIAVFLNATTVDGYNPYRITHQGIDWEVPEPDNPWSNIGYWGDHQIVYLLRLLEMSRDLHPNRLTAHLDKAIFATADLPYRIGSFEEILENPSATISFDEAQDRQIRERAQQIGGDGMLKHEPSGELFYTTLADKLLLLAAAKMVNFVPDGGIWMNTQRPEWNDANNALVGHGASVVTMAHMARFLDHLTSLFGKRDLLIRPELAELVRTLTVTLQRFPSEDTLLDGPCRFAMVAELGQAGAMYRRVGYTEHDAVLTTLSADGVADFLTHAGAWCRRGVKANRRADGLFHSYNTLQLTHEAIDVDTLPLMLEGQVAVLWAGGLEPAEVLAVTKALRTSALYRGDQHSYLLYPDRDLTGFLASNNVPAETLAKCHGAEAMLGDSNQLVLVRDGEGGVHFAEGVRNASVLSERLDDVERSGMEVDRECLMEVYEETFRHSNFTGRSGSFFAYEGLGSIYWHMVSKLALSVLEVRNEAITDAVGNDVVQGLEDAFRDIRSGLGFTKTAHEFGGFPTDPYSHTPAHTGARQPGMTGQAKEDVIMRFSELGVSVSEGILGLHPDRVADEEWLEAPATLNAPSGKETLRTIAVERDQLAFTLCGVPIVYERGGSQIVVQLSDGEEEVMADGLDGAVCARIFARDGFVQQIRVQRDRCLT